MGGDQGRTRDATPTDTSLFARAAMAGDRAAFERLVELHQEAVFRMAYARLRNVSDAQDVVQDVFMNAYRNIKTLRDPELFRAWLYRIALNRTKDMMRKRRVLVFFGLEEPGEPESIAGHLPDGYDSLEARRFWERLDEFLSCLSALQREVFRLRFLDGLAINEICDVLGKNESTIKTHLYRSIEKFKDAAGLFDGVRQEAGENGSGKAPR